MTNKYQCDNCGFIVISKHKGTTYLNKLDNEVPCCKNADYYFTM